MDAPRLHAALTAIARRYAPTATPAELRSPTTLADRLALEGVLVLASTLPTDRAREAPALYKDWADQVSGLYRLLAGALFPSSPDVQAFYADQAFPPIVIVVGQSVPVIALLAGAVIPFMAARRAAGLGASPVELRGLLDSVLDELEAGDLPRDAYRRLRDDGAALVQGLLASPIQPLPLTRALLPGLAVLPAAPASPRPAPPTPPPDLPETGTLRSPAPPAAPPTAPARPSGTAAPPIFFQTGDSPTRRAPVPDVPPRQRPTGG